MGKMRRLFYALSCVVIVVIAIIPASHSLAKPAINFLLLGNSPTITSVTVNVGATSGGMHHTISGRNFTKGPITVTFGGNPATNVVRVDDATITCDSPPGTAGETNVTVNNTKGMATSPFTYFVPIWAADGGTGAPNMFLQSIHPPAFFTRSGRSALASPPCSMPVQLSGLRPQAITTAVPTPNHLCC